MRGHTDEPQTQMCFGMLADEETTTGFLLASLGESIMETGTTNYYIVEEKTPFKKLREYFLKLYSRKNIAVLLISTDIAAKIDFLLEKANKMLPIILKIPGKDCLPPLGRNVERNSLADVARMK